MWEATCIVILLVVLLLYKGTRKPKRFPPGPPRLPIVGSLPYMAVRSKPSEPKSLLTGVRKGIVSARIEELFLTHTIITILHIRYNN